MNQELTTEQKARVFAMYLGCPLRFKSFMTGRNRLGILSDAGAGGLSVEYSRVYQDSTGETLGWDPALTGNGDDALNAKLLLRPLSAITDEDAITVAKILDIDNMGDKEGFIEAFYQDAPGFMIDAYKGAAYFWVSQFLIQRGYAVPLFIAPGHPLNGKTAIEMGMAIVHSYQP